MSQIRKLQGGGTPDEEKKKKDAAAANNTTSTTSAADTSQGTTAKATDKTAGTTTTAAQTKPAVTKTAQQATAKPTGGNFYMNGRTLNKEQALQELARVYQGVDMSTRGMGSVAYQALMAGDDVYYNPYDNTIRTMHGNTDTTRNYTNTKASISNSRFFNRWGATFNNEAHRFKESGRYLGNINMNVKAPEEPATPGIELARGAGNIYGHKDEDGKYVYDANDAWGANNLDYIKNIWDWMNDNEPDLDKRYAYTKWKGHDEDRARLRDLTNNLGAD